MTIDLRSDTVTRPTDAMRRAMAIAEVGDDVFGEDPTVLALEATVAERFGRQAAMFVASGTMATQTLLLALCERGTEVFCEAGAHLVAYEAGAGAVLANVQFRTIEGDRGRLDADLVEPRLRPALFPYTQLGAISVEETTNRGGGAIHGLDRLAGLRDVADRHGVPLHGDGARLFNAVVATGHEPSAWGRVFSALSFCLSKGLGAPVGSVVVGDRDVVDAARSWRRRLGGGMRQAGVLAAAGLHALDHHVERLAEDHDSARLIAEHLASQVPGSVDVDGVETNIVYVDTGSVPATTVVDELAARDVRIGAMGETLVRLVTHLDVGRVDARRAAEILAEAIDPDRARTATAT